MVSYFVSPHEVLWLCILMTYIYVSTDKQSQARSKDYGDLYLSH